MQVWHAETIAHVVLTLFTDIEQEREHTGGANLTVAFGNNGSGFGGSKDKTTPDDKWSWLMSVGCILRDVNARYGLLASQILVERYVYELTFPRIAINTGLRELVCERISEAAVTLFTNEVERKGLLQFVQDREREPVSNSCLTDAALFPWLLVQDVLAVVPGHPADNPEQYASAQVQEG